MVGKVCPKCRTAAGDDDVTCGSCQYVLDTSFLDDGSGLVKIAEELAERDDGGGLPGRIHRLATADADEIDMALGLLSADDLSDDSAALAQPLPEVSEVAFADDGDGGGTEEVAFLEDGEEELGPSADLVDEDDPLALALSLDDDRSPFADDALTRGDVSPPANGKPVDFESMLSDQTGTFSIPGAPQRVFEPASGSIAANVQAMMEPAAVLAVKDRAGLSAVMLSPFEQHVVALIDGVRPVARIAKKSGLVMGDLKIAIGLLAERALIVLKGKYKLDVGTPRDSAPPDTSPGQPTPFAEPMPLPLDALTPLPLPLDALTPLPPPLPRPAIPADQVVVKVASLVEEIPAQDTAFSGAAVRPSMNLRAATTVTAVKPSPSALAPGAKPGSTPPAPAPARAPAPAPVKAPPPKPAIVVPPEAKARAQQVLELALKDLREGKKARALAYVKMASEIDPTDEKIRGLLTNWGRAEGVAKSESEEQRLVADARSAEDAGKFEDAAALYKKAIALRPNDPELFNRLGIILALRVKDYTGATSMLMKATELAPTNLAYRSNLGKVFKLAEGKAPRELEMQAGDESAATRAAQPAKAGGLLGLFKKK